VRREWPRLPRKVKSTFVDVPVTLEERFDDDSILGLFSSAPRPVTIKILDRLPEHTRWEVFFHELLHLVESESGVELRDDPADNDVDRFSRALLALWVRNGWSLPGE